MADELKQPAKPSYYPSIFTAPSEKATKGYNLETMKALYWNNWNAFQNAYGNSYRNRMMDNRAWSNGNFDIRAFIGGKKQKNNRDKNPLLKHLDFDPVTEQSKYRDIVVSYMEELDFDVVCTTINPAGVAIKENKRLNELAILKNKQSGYSAKIDAQAGMPIMPQSQLPFPVNDQQEFDLYYQLGGAKEIFELEMELANQIVLNDSDWKAIKKQLLEDAFDCGKMIIDTEYDKAGRIKIKYVDPINCGVEEYRGHYLKRPNRIWYTDMVTIQQLLLDADGQFTIEEAMAIAQMFEGQWGNPIWSNAQSNFSPYTNTDSTTTSYPYFFYSFKVPVMKAYWEEIDYYDTGGGKKAAVHKYYSAKWIVNTDWIYDFGPVKFQSRDPYDPRFSLCPMKHYRIANQPLAEKIKVYAKKIYMTWQKIDNEVANKIPSGYKLNIKALENISLGQGQTFTVKHGIELVNETGRLVYSDEAQADEFGRSLKKDPIEIFDTSTPFARAIDAWIKLIQFYEDRIMKISGINEFMDATNPNSNTPASVAQLAAQGSKHSMAQIASGLLDMAEKICLDCTERVRLVIQEQGQYNGYADVLGNGMAEMTTISPDVVAHRYGIMVAAKPTAAEKEAFKQAIYQSFANMAAPEQGGLWMADVMKYQEMVNAKVNMKLIRIMIQATQKANMAAVQKQKLELITAQSDQNAKNMEAASKAKIQELQAEATVKLQYEQGLTIEINKRVAFENMSKTDNAMVKETHKTGQKIIEKQFENATGE